MSKPIYRDENGRSYYYVFRKTFTKNGRIYRAEDYGKKAWPIRIYLDDGDK